VRTPQCERRRRTRREPLTRASRGPHEVARAAPGPLRDRRADRCASSPRRSAPYPKR
jgi:hypothetical protein